MLQKKKTKNGFEGFEGIDYTMLLLMLVGVFGMKLLIVDYHFYDTFFWFNVAFLVASIVMFVIRLKQKRWKVLLLYAISIFVACFALDAGAELKDVFSDIPLE